MADSADAAGEEGDPSLPLLAWLLKQPPAAIGGLLGTVQASSD